MTYSTHGSCQWLAIDDHGSLMTLRQRAQQYPDVEFDLLYFHTAEPSQQKFLLGYGRDVLPS